MRREALNSYLEQLLDTQHYRDYCPNGLQVEGRPEVQRLVCGVTANQALIDAAVRLGADAILVHHGWFWRGEDGRVVGMRKTRLSALLAADINLFAYHLPLDGHATLGNNAQLARLAGWTIERRFGDQDIACLGVPVAAGTVGQLADSLASLLGRTPLLIGDADKPVQRLAWCSGGAQGWFEQAIATGADAYISGEISEQTVHLARESGVAYLAAGHHATERYGVMALAAHLQEQCGLDCQFVDIDNPV